MEANTKHDHLNVAAGAYGCGSRPRSEGCRARRAAPMHRAQTRRPVRGQLGQPASININLLHLPSTCRLPPLPFFGLAFTCSSPVPSFTPWCQPTACLTPACLHMFACKRRRAGPAGRGGGRGGVCVQLREGAPAGGAPRAHGGQSVATAQGHWRAGGRQGRQEGARAHVQGERLWYSMQGRAGVPSSSCCKNVSGCAGMACQHCGWRTSAQISRY